MNTFKRKSLYAALGGLVAAGAAGTANAVFVNDEGLGQAMVYPYYTVRGGNDTLISVVNSTASAKAVKVRVLEGKNSKEVLDFNLYLSAYDVWTAAIRNNATTGAAQIATSDRSCTTPPIPAAGQDFRNVLFTAAEGDTSVDRTREGYIEILEMGTVVSGTTLEAGVTHNPSTGIPTCANIPTVTLPAGLLVPPTGGMFGGGTVINVPRGTAQSYDAVAFDQWSSAVNWTPPQNILPDLSSADPVSTVISGTSAVTVLWAGVNPGADAVSSTIMHNAVMNEYVTNAGINATTDWVLTFPTKRFYVATGPANSQARPPFQRNFSNLANPVGACDDIGLAYFDREERRPGSTVDFSPVVGAAGPVLCWEVNVITFNRTSPTPSPVLNSQLASNINATDPATGQLYPDGWARVTFPTAITGANPAVHTLTSGPGTRINLSTTAVTPVTSVTFSGLPVVGFAAVQYVNGNVGGVQSNYGASFKHKTTSQIQ